MPPPLNTGVEGLEWSGFADLERSGASMGDMSGFGHAWMGASRPLGSCRTWLITRAWTFPRALSLSYPYRQTLKVSLNGCRKLERAQPDAQIQPYSPLHSISSDCLATARARSGRDVGDLLCNMYIVGSDEICNDRLSPMHRRVLAPCDAYLLRPGPASSA